MKEKYKEVLQNAVKNGYIDDYGKVNSIMILLFSIAEGFKADAEESERRAGIAHREMKQATNKRCRAFDEYKRSYQKLMDECGKSSDLIEDYEELEKIIRGFLKFKD